jgi:O-antigen/teichoic acid export membrane protein
LDLRQKRNVFWKAVEAVVTITASFIQLAAIARYYAPDVVGEYQLTLAWLFFVSALSCFGGIAMVSTRELTNCPETQRSSIFSNAIVLQALVALPLCITCILIFYNTNYFRALAFPLVVGSIGLLGSMILQVSQALLVSKEQITKVVAASTIGHLVATFALIVAASQNLPIVALVSAWATYNIANGSVLVYETKSWQLISLSLVRLAELRKLTAEIMPVLVMVLATHLYVRIDVIMLDYFTNKEVVAQYSAGYLFLDQLMILSNFMMGALFPNFARSCLAHGKDYQVLYHGIVRLFLKYLVPIAISIAVCSRFLLATIYGPEYAASWKSLSVLMVAAMFAWINGPSGTIFISLKKQHIYMWATLLSLLVNIVGNLILVPTVGAIGAAVSTVLTEAAICGFCLWWIYQETGYLPWMKPQIKGTTTSS